MAHFVTCEPPPIPKSYFECQDLHKALVILGYNSWHDLEPGKSNIDMKYDVLYNIYIAELVTSYIV